MALFAALAPVAILALACGSGTMEILSFTSPLRAGEVATLTVRARPDTLCEVVFTFAGVASTPARLPKTPADPAGFVSWQWRFDPGTPPQDVKAQASCEHEGSTQTDEKTIEIIAGP